MTAPSSNHFAIQRIAFTGPTVPIRQLTFIDGVNVLWGASNTGKSFTVKAFDFMSGAGSTLPDIKQRQGYDQAWLEIRLPRSGIVTLVRAISGGDFGVFDGSVEPGTAKAFDRTLSAEHKTKGSLSGFLLSELGIAGKKIARTQNGEKASFTFRHFAPYIYTEETDMLGEWSPIRISDYANPTFEKNVLKFILTGDDDSAVVKVPSAKDKRTVKAGKIELIAEMLASAEQEFRSGYPDGTNLGDQETRIAETIRELHRTLTERQEALDRLRRDRRALMDAIADTEDRRTEIGITLERFAMLRSIYDSDTERLISLEEGGAALLAGSRRDCPLCGADPDHQRIVHGVEEVERAHRSVQAEISKIRSERADLLKASASLEAEMESLLRKSERLASDIEAIDRGIAAAKSAEASNRESYEQLDRARDHVRQGQALFRRIQELRRHKSILESSRTPSTPRAMMSVGVGGIVGHELATSIQSVLHAWKFPGMPTVSFDDASHDILIDGQSRRANGKGVRALMNAAFKIGLFLYCREKNRPHPGILVLDSPLLAYREPLKSRHGELSEDEKVVKASGLKDNFYRFLSQKAGLGQFIIVENEEPSIALGPDAKVMAFAGPDGEGDRVGLF